MVRTYICIQDFQLVRFDDDGRSTEDSIVFLEGDVFFRSEDPYRVAGGPDTIRLEGLAGWMEITPEHLAEYFVEIPGVGQEAKSRDIQK